MRRGCFLFCPLFAGLPYEDLLMTRFNGGAFLSSVRSVRTSSPPPPIVLESVVFSEPAAALPSPLNSFTAGLALDIPPLACRYKISLEARILLLNARLFHRCGSSFPSCFTCFPGLALTGFFFFFGAFGAPSFFAQDAHVFFLSNSHAV